MKYITEIIYTALVCGLLTRIAPNGGTKNGKYVKLIASLVFLLVLAGPLVDLKDGDTEIYKSFFEADGVVIGDMEENNSTAYQTSLEVVSQEICRAAARTAAEEFSVDEGVFSINLTIENRGKSDYSIGEVEIYLKDEEDKINRSEAETFFKRIFSGAEKVVIV